MNMGTYKVVHGKNGRFMSLKRYLTRLALIWGTIAALFYFFIFGHPKVLQALDIMMAREIVAEAATSTPTLIEELKMRSLNDLWDEALTNLSYGCEVKGVPASEQEGKITFDTNKKASIGIFQYQQTTVVHYYKEFFGKEITIADANKIASTKAEAWDLTKKIARKHGIISDWTNCANREFKLKGSTRTLALKDFVEVLRVIEL